MSSSIVAYDREIQIQSTVKPINNEERLHLQAFQKITKKCSKNQFLNRQNFC